MWVLIITVLNSFNILNSKLLNLYQFVDTHSTGIFLYVRCLSGQPDADITLSRASHVYIYIYIHTLSKQKLHPPSTPSKQCYHKQTALSKQCLHTPTTFSKQCFFAGTVAGDAKHLGYHHMMMSCDDFECGFRMLFSGFRFQV